MFSWYRTGSHTLTSCKAHIVWCTKYRYEVLSGDVKTRCRDLVRQICEYLDIQILKWVISWDHVHLMIEYPPKHSISEIVKRLKWKTSRMLLQEYKDLSKRYRWKHFRAVGYFCSTSWNITDDLIKAYLEHHRTWYDKLKDDNVFILE